MRVGGELYVLIGAYILLNRTLESCCSLDSRRRVGVPGLYGRRATGVEGRYTKVPLLPHLENACHVCFPDEGGVGGGSVLSFCETLPTASLPPSAVLSCSTTIGVLSLDVS